ncbi:MAG: hypothetical protein LBS22_02715 [Puniceicoccales bacterium]|nr:hypothetical protein [Puniceicoccales bacterium]
MGKGYITSICCVILVLMCTGCKTMGGDLPGCLARNRRELEAVNGQLYNHLQTLLWTGRYNHMSGNGVVCERALEGCMEIVGYPDAKEKVVSESIGLSGVETMVKESVTLRERKKKLLTQMVSNSDLLSKRYITYESSHRALKSLKIFGGACGAVLVVVLFLSFPRLR